MTGGAAHWDGVYADRGPEGVTWYRSAQDVSRVLLDALPARPGSVVDIGGGASTLVDALLDRGVPDVTVLDLSETALEASRLRLGERARGVEWVAGDVLAWDPGRPRDVWHDRAAFHFLVEPADRDRYRRVLGRCVRPGGHVIVATFAPDGPDRCSGLPVMRYGPEALVAALGEDLALVEARREEHVTPSGRTQAFTWILARRGD